MTDIAALCPKDEMIWVGYYSKTGEPLFFLTSPKKMTSTLAAQTGSFTLYAVTAGAKGALKAKKLGQGVNPTEPELKYGVREKWRRKTE